MSTTARMIRRQVIMTAGRNKMMTTRPSSLAAATKAAAAGSSMSTWTFSSAPTTTSLDKKVRPPSMIMSRSKRPKSTQPVPDADERAEVDEAKALLMRTMWKSYLASGRGSPQLFASIASSTLPTGGGTTELEAGHGGRPSLSTISPREVRAFVQAIGGRGVHPRAFARLQALAQNHAIDLHEFQSWLIAATKFTDEKNSRLFTNFLNLPDTGLSQALAKQMEDDVDGVDHVEAELARKQAEAEREIEDLKHTIVEPKWNVNTMNQNVRRMQYAVRGSVVMLAETLQSQGKEILYTNIGNPQSVGQNPITYFRQTLALCDLPHDHGIDHPSVTSMFPPDVIERARSVKKAMGFDGGTGAYTGSQGVLQFREEVAHFIEERDGHKAYPGNIFLTNGASSAIDLVLTCLIANDSDAVMIPIPQYPIYSALIARCAGRQIGYFLDEEKGWGIDLDEIESRLTEAHADDLHVKALVVINPGNPTGQVLDRADLERLCLFCAKHQIVLMADEVYQRNVYVDHKEFVSAKKVAMETPGCENLQLVSFHSTSKGLIGECGRRGGYMEMHNIDPVVQSQVYKLASSALCSNVPGQVLTSLMVNPPKPGDASYDLFHEEETAIYEGLKRRAHSLVDGLNSIDGISCQPAEGAMYAFPRVELPEGAIQEAIKQETTPDTLYALSLLEETGICVVPASGFGQREGRFGFRTTFLPPDDKMMKAIDQFKDHHKLFCDKYS